MRGGQGPKFLQKPRPRGYHTHIGGDRLYNYGSDVLGKLLKEIPDCFEIMETARTDADSAKTSLISVQSEIKNLKAERDTMLAKMQSAQARMRIQEQLDGLSVDDEVKALDNVRTHIKNVIAEANLSKELSDSSLDARLAAVRNQVGNVQAKQELASLKARKAAQQASQGQKTM